MRILNAHFLCTAYTRNLTVKVAPMHFIPDATLQALITEDAPYGDLTTRALGLEGTASHIRYTARYDMTVCGSEEAERILTMLGATTQRHIDSGTTVPAGTLLLEATAPAEAILTAWKVTQNLIEWTSGIASTTQTMVNIAHTISPKMVIACTRKSAPGTRALSMKAICCAGASPHRCGLSDTILIFPEHLALFQNPQAQTEAIRVLKCKTPERSIVMEVKNIEDALAAADLGIDVLQLEKFSPEAIRTLHQAFPPTLTRRPIIAAAGGINPQNTAAYAASGADVLVTSFPYTARPADVQVTISRR